ncbi:MAG: sodium:solute symporter, partial [Flavobacteriales bacterium]|nr:sodium:solute symporter [Flavobacteriales bacterium]
NFFFKDFIGGVFTAVAMTGLDQNMMQKNLSCKSLPEAQKNITWFSIIMVVVNVFFLSLGVLLYHYCSVKNIQLPIDQATGKVITDQVFPTLALNYLGVFSGLAFIMGLTAATFSSADSVLTTLTTSAYIDVLEVNKNNKLDSGKKKMYRNVIHIAFTILLWLIILVFKELNKAAIVDTILIIAGYTYGPLLALFTLGLFTKIQLRDSLVPIMCVIGPILCYIFVSNASDILGSYKIGMELIVWNALITGSLLLLIRKKSNNSIQLQS